MIFIINAEYIFCIMIMVEKKFGDVLMSRPAGKDAFLLAESHLFSSLNTMGTFNFFNPNTKLKEHKKTDLDPYIRWGN